MRTPELLIILKSMNLLKIWSNLILALQYFFQKIQIVLHQGVGCIQKFSLTHIIYTSQNLTASILYWPKGNNSWKNMSAMLFPGIPIYIPVSRAYASMHLLIKCWFSATQITCQFLLLQYSDIIYSRLQKSVHYYLFSGNYLLSQTWGYNSVFCDSLFSHWLMRYNCLVWTTWCHFQIFNLLLFEIFNLW